MPIEVQLMNKYMCIYVYGGSLVAQMGESTCNTVGTGEVPESGRFGGGRGQSTPGILVWRISWKKLMGYSPWECKEMDTAERLGMHMHAYLAS